MNFHKFIIPVFNFSPKTLIMTTCYKSEKFALLLNFNSNLFFFFVVPRFIVPDDVEEIATNTCLQEVDSNNLIIKKKPVQSQLGDGIEMNLVKHILNFKEAGYEVTSKTIRKIAYDLSTHFKIRTTFNITDKMAGWRWLHSFVSRREKDLGSEIAKGLTTVARTARMKEIEERNYMRLSRIVMQDYGVIKPEVQFLVDDRISSLEAKLNAEKMSDLETENNSETMSKLQTENDSDDIFYLRPEKDSDDIFYLQTENNVYNNFIKPATENDYDNFIKPATDNNIYYNNFIGLAQPNSTITLVTYANDEEEDFILGL